MNTSLENYIKKNRDALDTDIPDKEQIWETISANLKSAPKIYLKNFLKVAAVFFLLLGTTWILIEKTTMRRAVPKSIDLFCNQVYMEKKQLYQQQLNQKQDQALHAVKSARQTEILTFLGEELKEIDLIQQEVYSDMRISGCRQNKINLIYQTYEKKIATLDKIILESTKNKSNENL